MREAAMLKVLQQLKEWQQRVKGGGGGGSLSDVSTPQKQDTLSRDREVSVREHKSNTFKGIVKALPCLC